MVVIYPNNKPLPWPFNDEASVLPLADKGKF